ncbi:chitinase domain-containing protein 1 [Phymastichus coffea]|uniref:chitinase domain-containing protein 1 n=1 Tax=Phymastichus coffea TaxID=108790 RepID=UPI00273BD443|nr:chitinase domain-containing protein 1 [Phymastichus coffea]
MGLYLQRKIGPVDKDAYQRHLVKTTPKVSDILRESGLYGKDTKYRNFVAGDVLGYITPWNGEGYEQAKRFHGKFDMVSPVWFTINSKSPFKIPTHDIQKSWLHDMRADDNDNHTVKVLPRIIFDGWSNDDIIELFSNIKKRDKLISTLVDLAENYSFDGYVMEIWNQFIFVGAKKNVVTNLIIALADGLRKKGFYTILAVPPWRGSYTFILEWTKNFLQKRILKL